MTTQASLPQDAANKLAPMRVVRYAGLVVCVAAAVWIGSHVPNADWYGTFDAAGRGIIHGRSPYEQPLFANPPWAVLLLMPFVWLTPALARGLVLTASIASLVYIGWRLHAPRLAFIAVLLSPTAIGAMLAANLDAFVMPGIFLAPVYGLLLLMIKPQIGVGPAIYYLVEAWRASRLAGVLRTFAPLAVASLLGALVFPVWIQRLIASPDIVWNRSIFPFGVPVGVALLWAALRTHNRFLALASAPFLSPYLTFYTYLVVQVGLLHPDVEKVVRRDVLQVILCIFLWIIMLIYKL